MNNRLRITLIIAAGVAVIAVGVFAGTAFAQTPQPPRTPWGGGHGYGHMGGYDMHGYGGFDHTAMHDWMLTSGGMHTLVWDGLAEALNLTPDELNAELASGKTLLQIAEAQGVSQDELAAALQATMQAGLEQAVADGVLAQEQADWMLAQMGSNYLWMLDHMGAGFGGEYGGCHENWGAFENS